MWTVGLLNGLLFGTEILRENDILRYKKLLDISTLTAVCFLLVCKCETKDQNYTSNMYTIATNGIKNTNHSPNLNSGSVFVLKKGEKGPSSEQFAAVPCLMSVIISIVKHSPSTM
mgnify:FL=1